MTPAIRVAILGFSEFERKTLASCFRLAGERTPRYEQVLMLTVGDFVVADADHAPSVQLVEVTERLADTVYVGARRPPGAAAWLPRPIDPPKLMRELDALVAARAAAATPAVAEPAGPGLAAERPRGASPEPAPTPAPRPLPAPSPLPPPVPAAGWPAAPPPLALPPPSALLVDDSEVALRFLQGRLQRYGLRIERASSSRQAIALLAQCDYDFVFLDVELGAGNELDGLALCQHIKRLDHGGAAITSAVFMVSAHCSELDRVRGALAGCDAYLAKPLDEDELERLLRRHGVVPGRLPPADAVA
jgi:CheY-like chemotaxis protein